MSDLFYNQGETLIDKINFLKKDLMAHAKTLGCTKRKISIIQGNHESVGNNVLIVSPPFIGDKAFEDPTDKALIGMLSKYNIENYFMTYANAIPLERHTKDNIKNYRYWIEKIVEIIQPRLIVVLGEEAQLAFFKRKVILRDHHSLIIGYYGDIPVMLVHPMDYFVAKSSYEDSGYKTFIESKDWTAVKTEYDRRIKCQ